jgi:hypothetical protein
MISNFCIRYTTAVMRTWFYHPAFHSQVTDMRPLIACLILYSIRIYLTHIVQCDAHYIQIMVSSYGVRAEQVVHAPAKYFAKSRTISFGVHLTHPKYVNSFGTENG